MTTAAVIQLNSGDDVARNLATTAGFLRQARQQGASLAVLPENFAWMGPEPAAAAIAETASDGPIQQFLHDISRETGLHIIAGSIRLHANERGMVSNSCLVYDDKGQQLSRYDKIHLFDAVVASGEAYRESDTFVAGNRVVDCTSPAGQVGLTICYDLRFPALFSQLREQGAQLITVPAAFTHTTGQAHWQPLLRARAIENQAYILAAAQTGKHPTGRSTYGHAMIIDPWGKVLANAGTEPGFATAEINLELLKQLRQNMPVSRHQRDLSKLTRPS